MSVEARELLAGIAGAKVVDLEHPRRFGDPIFPSHQPGTILTLHRRHEAGTSEARTGASGLLVTTEHAGTHIDALCHQAENLRLHGGVPITPDLQTPNGFTSHGIDTVAPIVARGVLLDLAALRGEPLPAGELVSDQELREAQRRQGTEIGQGDVVLVRTGNARHWSDPERYLQGAGMSGQASEWLAGLGVRAVGADNVAWDLPGYVDEGTGTTLPGHVVLLVRHGIHIVENLNLEELAEGPHLEFLFVCLPLKVVGGTGCPVRPVAIVP